MSTEEPQDRVPNPVRAESSAEPAWEGSGVEPGPAAPSGPVSAPHSHGPAIKILVTLLARTSGSARVCGFDTAGQPSRIRQVIGYTGQFIGIDDDLTVLGNLAISGMLHRLPHGAAWDRAAELVSVFALTAVVSVRAGRLSGGMRRRLDLAVALMHRPPVLFLDEPTTGMDPQSRNAVWEHLRGLGEEGATVFLTTQYLEEAPGWLQDAMKGNPAAYVITTGQQLMNAGNNWGQDLRTLAALVISGLILIPAAVTAFRSATH